MRMLSGPKSLQNQLSMVVIALFLLPLTVIDGQTSLRNPRQLSLQEVDPEPSQCSHPFHSFLCKDAPKRRPITPDSASSFGVKIISKPSPQESLRKFTTVTPVSKPIVPEGASSFNVKSIADPFKDDIYARKSNLPPIPYLPPLLDSQPSSVNTLQRKVESRPSEQPSILRYRSSNPTPTQPPTTRYFTTKTTTTTHRPTTVRTTPTYSTTVRTTTKSLQTDSSFARESRLKPLPYLPPVEEPQATFIDAQAAQAPSEFIKPGPDEKDQCKHTFHSFLCSPVFKSTGRRNRPTGALPSNIITNTLLQPQNAPLLNTDRNKTSFQNLGFGASFVQPTEVRPPFGSTVFPSDKTSSTTPIPLCKYPRSQSVSITHQAGSSSIRASEGNAAKSVILNKDPLTGLPCIYQPTATKVTERPTLTSRAPTERTQSTIGTPLESRQQPIAVRPSPLPVQVSRPAVVVPQAAQDSPVIAAPDPSHDHDHHHHHGHRDLCSDPFHSFLCQKIDTSKRRQQYGRRFQNSKPNGTLAGESSFLQTSKLLPPERRQQSYRSEPLQTVKPTPSPYNTKPVKETPRPKLQDIPVLPSRPHVTTSTTKIIQTTSTPLLLREPNPQPVKNNPISTLPSPTPFIRESSSTKPHEIRLQQYITQQVKTTTVKPLFPSNRQNSLPQPSRQAYGLNIYPRPSTPKPSINLQQTQTSRNHDTTPIKTAESLCKQGLCNIKNEFNKPIKQTSSLQGDSSFIQLERVTTTKPSSTGKPKAGGEIQPQAAQTSEARISPDHDHNHDHDHHHHPPGFDICKDPFHSFLCQVPKPRRRFTGQRQTPGRIDSSISVESSIPQPSRLLPSTLTTQSPKPSSTTSVNLSGSSSFQQPSKVLAPSSSVNGYFYPKPEINPENSGSQNNPEVEGYFYQKPTNGLQYPENSASQNVPEVSGYSYPKPSNPLELPTSSGSQNIPEVSGYSYPRPSNPLEAPIKSETQNNPQVLGYTYPKPSNPLEFPTNAETQENPQVSGYTYPKPPSPIQYPVRSPTDEQDNRNVGDNSQNAPVVLPSTSGGRESEGYFYAKQVSTINKEVEGSASKHAPQISNLSSNPQIKTNLHSEPSKQGRNYEDAAEIFYRRKSTRQRNESSSQESPAHVNLGTKENEKRSSIKRASNNVGGVFKDQATEEQLIYKKPSSSLQGPYEDSLSEGTSQILGLYRGPSSGFNDFERRSSSYSGLPDPQDERHVVPPFNVGAASDISPSYTPSPTTVQSSPLPAEFVRGPTGAASAELPDKCSHPFNGYSCKKSSSRSQTRVLG